MTRENLKKTLLALNIDAPSVETLLGDIDDYCTEASNGAKPIVSGSLCCQCGIRSKKIGDMCISCKHGWTGRQHNDR